ncbi:hypothetical protein GCM10009827_090940 [Dactylosporangium maewongense]|uniref:Uncharacterized protein n=1 Tax=Dactylosporangium maewongense TaxID=634393 RepID=A0ABN2CEZ6_9ACTN
MIAATRAAADRRSHATASAAAGFAPNAAARATYCSGGSGTPSRLVMRRGDGVRVAAPSPSGNSASAPGEETDHLELTPQPADPSVRWER